MRINSPLPDLPPFQRGAPMTVQLDGQAVPAYRGETVAAVLLAEGQRIFRRTLKTGRPRGLFCGIGLCYDCLVTVDGMANVRACLTPVVEGIFSLECLTVDGHEKRGQYVPSHIHMNVTYLLAAEDDALREKPDENSGVAWFTPEEALAASTEPWMVQRVYRKLADRAAAYMKT